VGYFQRIQKQRGEHVPRFINEGAMTNVGSSLDTYPLPRGTSVAQFVKSHERDLKSNLKNAFKTLNKAHLIHDDLKTKGAILRNVTYNPRNGKFYVIDFGKMKEGTVNPEAETNRIFNLLVS